MIRKIDQSWATREELSAICGPRKALVRDTDYTSTDLNSTALIISNRGGHARFTDALLPTSGERIQSGLPNWDLEAGVAARTDRRLALIGHGCIVQI
jgi:hypothetical protein